MKKVSLRERLATMTPEELQEAMRRTAENDRERIAEGTLVIPPPEDDLWEVDEVWLETLSKAWDDINGGNRR